MGELTFLSASFPMQRCVFHRGGLEASPPFYFQMRFAPARIDHLFSTDVRMSEAEMEVSRSSSGL